MDPKLSNWLSKMNTTSSADLRQSIAASVTDDVPHESGSDDGSNSGPGGLDQVNVLDQMLLTLRKDTAYRERLRSQTLSEALRKGVQADAKLDFVDPADVRSGSVPRLVELLTDPQTCADAYVDTFFLTYHAFMGEDELFLHLYARFMIEPPAVVAGTLLAQWQSEIQKPTQTRVIDIIKTWLRVSVRDFASNAHVSQLLDEFLAMLRLNPDFAATADALAQLRDQMVRQAMDAAGLPEVARLMERSITQTRAKWRMQDIGLCFEGSKGVDYLVNSGISLTRDEAVELAAAVQRAGFIENAVDRSIAFADNFQLFRFNSANLVPESALPKSVLPKKLDAFEFDDLSPLEFARQETLIEQLIYSILQPKEVLGLAWTKADKEFRSPNVLSLIRRFNSISQWVVTELCRRKQLKDRVACLTRLIKLGEEFLALNNFNGMMAVISGLSNNATKRLKFTWAKLDKKVKAAFDRMAELVSQKSSFKNIREHLATVRPPAIPFLGVYLTDLTFVHEGNTDLTPEGDVNFRKHTLTASVVSSLLQFQRGIYIFRLIPQVRAWLTDLTGFDDEVVFDWSVEIEPREAVQSGSSKKLPACKSAERRPRAFASQADASVAVGERLRRNPSIRMHSESFAEQRSSSEAIEGPDQLSKTVTEDFSFSGSASSNSTDSSSGSSGSSSSDSAGAAAGASSRANSVSSASGTPVRPRRPTLNSPLTLPPGSGSVSPANGTPAKRPIRKSCSEDFGPGVILPTPGSSLPTGAPSSAAPSTPSTPVVRPLSVAVSATPERAASPAAASPSPAVTEADRAAAAAMAAYEAAVAEAEAAEFEALEGSVKSSDALLPIVGSNGELALPDRGTAGKASSAPPSRRPSDLIDGSGPPSSPSAPHTPSSRSPVPRRPSFLQTPEAASSPTTPGTPSLRDAAAALRGRLGTDSPTSRPREGSLGVRPASDAVDPAEFGDALIQAALDRDGKPGTPMKKVAMLLATGGAVDSANARGNTALHYCIVDERVEIVAFLIAQGASVNRLNASQVSPLHLAAHKDNLILARMLLDAGADRSCVTPTGQRPVDMAKSKEMTELLS